MRGELECRLLQVLRIKKFSVTPRAAANMRTLSPILAAVTDGVLVIEGVDVSMYNIKSNTWKGCYPKLNEARNCASACVLKRMVYVFCGLG